MKRRFLFVFSTFFLTLFSIAPSTVFADAPIEGRTGRAEVRFMEGMIDHHQMAIDMANHCLTKGTTESILSLCQNIIDAQSAEIGTLQGWLLNWYNIDYSPMSMDEMMEMMGGMEGMDHEGMPATDPAMMMGMMAGLNRLEGVDYEIAWLEAMADHHDDAIHMSERLLERAGDGHAELLAMAQQIIDDQTAEIDEIEQLLLELGA
jgi:uncharacterized protein (DUF305 family)